MNKEQALMEIKVRLHRLTHPNEYAGELKRQAAYMNYVTERPSITSRLLANIGIITPSLRRCISRTPIERPILHDPLDDAQAIMNIVENIDNESDTFIEPSISDSHMESNLCVTPDPSVDLWTRNKPKVVVPTYIGSWYGNTSRKYNNDINKIIAEFSERMSSNKGSKNIRKWYAETIRDKGKTAPYDTLIQMYNNGYEIKQ